MPVSLTLTKSPTTSFPRSPVGQEPCAPDTATQSRLVSLSLWEKGPRVRAFALRPYKFASNALVKFAAISCGGCPSI